MKNALKEALPYITAMVLIIIAIWLVIAGFVAFTNAQNQMNWCQYKNGSTPWSSSKSEETGKRWSPNPLTAGFTGECINPGDKGL
jgi:hypothetical protein